MTDSFGRLISHSQFPCPPPTLETEKFRCLLFQPFIYRWSCDPVWLWASGEGLVSSFSCGSIYWYPLLAWHCNEVHLACDWIWRTTSNSSEDHEVFVFLKHLEVFIRLHVWEKILLTTCFSFKQFMLIEKYPKEKLDTAVGHVIFFSNRHGTFIRILMKCIPIKSAVPAPYPHKLNMADSHV